MARSNMFWYVLGGAALYYYLSKPKYPISPVVSASPGTRPDEFAAGSLPSGEPAAGSAPSGYADYRAGERADYGKVIGTIPGTDVPVYSDEGFPVLQPGGRPEPRGGGVLDPSLPSETISPIQAAMVENGYTIFA